MKKIPKIWLWASIGLLATSASCEKKVTPAIEQINSCTECGGTFTVDLKGETVKLSYSEVTKSWNFSNGKFFSTLPCKFPKELLIEGKQFTFDGKGIEVNIGSSIPIPNQVPVFKVCIEKIY